MNNLTLILLGGLLLAASPSHAYPLTELPVGASINRFDVRGLFGLDLPESEHLVDHLLEYSYASDDDLFSFGKEKWACILAVKGPSASARTEEKFWHDGEFMSTRIVKYTSELFVLARNIETRVVGVVRFTAEGSALSKDPLQLGMASFARANHDVQASRIAIALRGTPRCAAPPAKDAEKELWKAVEVGGFQD